MGPALAVALDEFVPQGGELQIRRRAPWGLNGATWELVLWKPRKGERFPKATVRLQASTSVELLRKIEEWVDEHCDAAPAG